MKIAIIILPILLCVCNRIDGQTRTIYGRVIDEDLETLPYLDIKTKDFRVIGKTDGEGRFKIDIPRNTEILSFGWIGMEPANIKLSDDCDTVEVVMMYAGSYDFISPRKIDRLRLERFNKLPDLHLQAFKKGLFTKQSICYSRDFKPDKPTLDSIIKDEVKTIKHLKLSFKKLNIGDTVRIPFTEQHGGDGTDRTLLNYYSIFADMKKYTFTVKCIITDKNTRKRHYNLVCRVVNCDRCESPSVFRGELLKVGGMFTYDMKFFKILDQ